MFTFKGISTKEMRIIVEEPDNLIAKAPIKHEILNIEGRDDAIYYPLGRSPIEISLTLQLLEPSKVDQVLMWLDGEGELIYKDRKTRARIFSEVQPIRTSGIRLINIDVVRAPYWDVITDDYSKPWGTNLIPNGWNSFRSFGTGENYIENWDFEDGLNKWAKHMSIGLELTESNTVVLTKESRNWGGISQEVKAITKPIYRVKAKWMDGDKPIEFKIQHDSWQSAPFNFKEKNKWEIFEFESPRSFDASRLYLFFRNFEHNSKVEVDWLSVSELDEQHLVVEKILSQNGLTRIRTWGGNHWIKLMINMGKPYDREFTWGTFVKNIGDNDLVMRSNQGLVADIVMSKNDKYVFLTSNPEHQNYLQFQVGSKSKNENLDFIASNPTIVEGDKPPTWEADEFPRIVNEGNAIAKPLIRLTKGTSSTCEFEVNGIYFKYHFNQDDEVVIDCEKMEASDKGQLRNRHLTIGYEFPKLDPGPNVVKTISGDAIIEFKRKDRWL